MTHPSSSPTAARVFLSEARLAELAARIARDVEPTAGAYRALLAEAEKCLQREPHVPDYWFVPGYYGDPEGHRESKGVLEGDANAAYTLALAYRMSGEERYADQALRLVNAWATSLTDTDFRQDSTLSFSYHFPALLFAADLLRGHPRWTAEEQRTWELFLRDVALPLNCMDRQNNWGNWGLLLVCAVGAYLDDDSLLASGAERWKEFIATQIAEDGHLTHEVGRNNGTGDHGLWYSHFSLMPQTLAAEILRLRGIDLFDYAAPNGRTLRMAYERLTPWARRPETFPYYQGDVSRLGGARYVSYYEILNPRWPNADAQAMLETLRPLTATHSAPHLTFTHGEPLEEAAG
ncbi:MAG: alginate lyase family protein [Chloroflexi bacterium]|nr:alginate lyase family protein [Chloroflexota bacterium]